MMIITSCPLLGLIKMYSYCTQLRAWRGHDKNNVKVAKEIQNYGGILMASEVRSADRYWHVYESNRGQQYPAEYTPHVVGIMWNMMAQFQTWFGNAAYLAYGIQLLPLTAVAEKRDKIDWSLELYEPFKASCDAHFQDCQDQGWSVLVLAVLATVGHGDKAISKALELPEEVFTSAGGNGHSLTNTLWYLATRPHLDSPLVLEGEADESEDQTKALEQAMQAQSDVDDDDINSRSSDAQKPIVIDPTFNCGCPDSCNDEALDRYADGHSCRDRIIWLMTEQYNSEWDACHQVALEFPGRCASCNPLECSAAKKVVSEESEACPPCPKEVCSGQLNLCPLHSAPYLCTEGGSIGGCSRFPWPLKDGVCEGCCKLSKGCEAD
jgi:Glycosyl hydrolase family 81 C-terminal domain